jgi:uncharacterized Zn-binding protein involved in type VI secretion
MLRRFNITVGATTTAGGVVTASSSNFKTNGLLLALEGDPIDCPACHSKGRIKCDGPRLISRFNGKNYALHDDLCICHCDPPPRLVASQAQMWQTIDDSPSDTGWMTANQMAASTSWHFK